MGVPPGTFRAPADADAPAPPPIPRAGTQSTPPQGIPARKTSRDLRIAGMDAYEYCDLIRSL
jgi:hypothetical protein